MLDDLLELAAELVGDTAVDLLGSGGKKKGARPSGPQRRTAERGRPAVRAAAGRSVGKLTARRDKHHGEDPWEWKEEKPPWEG